MDMITITIHFIGGEALELPGVSESQRRQLEDALIRRLPYVRIGRRAISVAAIAYVDLG